MVLKREKPRKGKHLILVDPKEVPDDKTVGQVVADRLKELGLPTKDNRKDG